MQAISFTAYLFSRLELRTFFLITSYLSEAITLVSGILFG